MDTGRLVAEDDTEQDFTDILFDGEAVKIFERSITGRMLKRGGKDDSNAIARLVDSLCKGEDINGSIEEIMKMKPDKAKKLCQKTLSRYGMGFSSEKGGKTLYEALVSLIDARNGLQFSLAKTRLEEIGKALLKEKQDRRMRVKYSIKNNKIPLKIDENGRILPNSERAEWLLSLLKPVTINGDTECYPLIREMEKRFDFGELSRKLKARVATCGNDPRAIAIAVDSAAREYARAVLKKNPGRDMKFYSRAVLEYFKENFPVGTKTQGSQKRQALLEDSGTVSRLLEPLHIAGAVRRKLINQSTQLHILYGKLCEYCCSTGNKLPVNSETLQMIQVFGAVKKKLMTAVLWSVVRMRYLYDYQKDDDLLFDVDYRKKFLDAAEYSDRDVQACKERLRDYFRIDEARHRVVKDKDENECVKKVFSDDRELCRKLLDECATGIERIRNNIFHYRNASIMQVLKRIAADATDGDFCVLQRLFNEDVKNLDKAFSNRIRSMNLPLYYGSDLLARVFRRAEFTLYGPRVQMTPSFQRVYEHGRNLYLQYERENKTGSGQVPELKWYRQVQGADCDYADDARRAVRNLLQLIYRYHFLPEVIKDERLITEKIQKVLDRNKGLARDYGRDNYGYREIKEIFGKNGDIKLEDLMKEMQRSISEAERESVETGREKTDYASRFILDIFAEAFNDFLEINYGSEYHEIMNPVKNEAGAEAWPGDGSAVCLKTSFDGKSVERYLLVLYPVMRLLDDRELAELQQQMLRYRASMAGWRGRQNFGEDVKMAEKIEELAELVKLTGPEPRYKAQDWINQYRKFAEGKLEDYGELYMQSDGKTPVAHRAMGLLMRSGLLDLYKDVLKGLKQVTKEDYEIYTKKDWDGASGAAEAQALLQELHGKYENRIQILQMMISSFIKNYSCKSTGTTTR